MTASVPGPPDAHPVVLHVAQSVETGVAHVVTDHARHQLAHGWRVAVACPPGPLADLAAAAGAEIHPWHARREPGPSVLGEVLAVRRIVAGVDPLVVHLHSAKAGLAGRLLLRGRRPTVYTPHAWSWLAADGATRALALTWERRAAGWAVTVCLSPGEITEARRAGLRHAPVLIPNDVDPVALRAAAPATRELARAVVGLPTDAPVVVCCARLAPQKGQDVLLAAWSEVAAAVPEARLVLVGDGPDRESIARTAAALPGVTVVGAAPREEAAVWLKAASVATCPSRYEGMSLVPLECAALGVPVVASDVAGMGSELPASARRLVRPEDPAALAAALVRALSHPEESAEGGRIAAAWADRECRGPSAAARTVALYDQLLGRTTTRVAA